MTLFCFQFQHWFPVHSTTLKTAVITYFTLPYLEFPFANIVKWADSMYVECKFNVQVTGLGNIILLLVPVNLESPSTPLRTQKTETPTQLCIASSCLFPVCSHQETMSTVWRGYTRMHCDRCFFDISKLVADSSNISGKRLRFPHWVSVGFWQLPIFHVLISPIYSQCGDDRVDWELSVMMSEVS